MDRVDRTRARSLQAGRAPVRGAARRAPRSRAAASFRNGGRAARPRDRVEDALEAELRRLAPGSAARRDRARSRSRPALGSLTRESPGRYWLLAPKTDRAGARGLAERLAQAVASSSKRAARRWRSWSARLSVRRTAAMRRRSPRTPTSACTPPALLESAARRPGWTSQRSRAPAQPASAPPATAVPGATAG